MNEKQLEHQKAQIEKRLATARGRKFWVCPGCQQRTQVRLLDLVVRLYYVEPFSCTGGDYWTRGDKPTFYVTCPKCDKEMRLYHGVYKTIPYESLTPHGKAIHDAWKVCSNYEKDFRNVEERAER